MFVIKGQIIYNVTESSRAIYISSGTRKCYLSSSNRRPLIHLFVYHCMACFRSSLLLRIMLGNLLYTKDCFRLSIDRFIKIYLLQ